MYYAYYMCLKCKDKLIERKQKIKNDVNLNEHIETCGKCGNKLRLVCIGEKKIDNTKYKIFFNSTIVGDKDKCIKCIMKISNCSSEVASEKINMENSLLFEGDMFQTYLTMEFLDSNGIIYDVNPKFPFERLVYLDCPDCGGEANYKIEELENQEDSKYYTLQGWFCQKCNQWVASNYISRIAMDETNYKLIFSFEQFCNKSNIDFEEIINQLSNKKIVKKEFIAYGKAVDIDQILQRLKALNIGYKVEPPYPYEVKEFVEIDEEYLNKILDMNKFNH